jgi:AraC-like DNA-binding protein
MQGFEVGLDSFAICQVGKGWRLVVPAVPRVLLHLVLKGEGALDCGGRRAAFRQHDIIIVPRDVEKSIVVPGREIREVVAGQSCGMFTDGMVSFNAMAGSADVVLACGVLTAPGDVGPGLFDHLKEPLVASLDPTEPLQAIMDFMLSELSAPRPGTRVVTECLMKQALVLLLRQQMARADVSAGLLSAFGDVRLTRAVTAVLEQPGAAHTVSSLAKTAGMSRSAFASAFRDHYASTPAEFVQAVRLRTAAHLLKVGVLPVKVIAATVGYASRSQFSRAFRGAYGVDPTGYRAREAAFEDASPPQWARQQISRSAPTRPSSVLTA